MLIEDLLGRKPVNLDTDLLRGFIEGKRLVAETRETHTMRYFFPKELDLFLDTAGLAPVALGVFPDFDRAPDETTWNVMQVARRPPGPD